MNPDTTTAHPGVSDEMLAGLIARSRDWLTPDQFTALLERGGKRYADYLATGHQAAVEALEYAVEHGVDRVDDRLAATAARKGMPIGAAELSEALRRVRDHTLVLDGSAVAETAYLVADRYWTRRWDRAADAAPVGKWRAMVGPTASRCRALHEWLSPGYDEADVPGLG